MHSIYPLDVAGALNVTTTTGERLVNRGKFAMLPVGIPTVRHIVMSLWRFLFCVGAVMKPWKFWLSFVAVVLFTFMAIGYGWLQSSLPQLDGTIEINGPEATITIARDEHGVPHIDAASENDLAFGLGFSHAQDRLWQMEMNRRIGSGKVAEVLGEAGLGFDRFFRTLGFTHKAKSALDALPAETVITLESYAAGVNAFVNSHRGALPPEFVLTGVVPEPWTPVDSLVWQKMMWLDLSGNARHEVARARLLKKLSPQQVASLYPAYPGEEPRTMPSLASLYDQAPLLAAATALGPAKPEGYGSNNWVVSGEKTQSGLPLLANDPHLGLTTPSIWYLTRLHDRTKNTNIVGVSFPGAPGVVLGRNDHISWGFTNTAPDIMDLFIEKLVDEDSYLTPEGPKAFVVREEVIKVRGGEDVVLPVRETRHGPVVSDVYAGSEEFTGDDHVIALQWTALMPEDTGVVALQKLGQATNFEEFQAAGKYYRGPQQNMIYADTDGNIGYYAPALVPVRRADNEIGGFLPSPGWDSKYDWQGFVAYDELPTRFNPTSNVIATANEKIIDKDYPHFITHDWSLPYRGNRIRSVLGETDQHTSDTFAALHADTISDMARDILPWMIDALEASPVKDALATWDGNMATETSEPLIFYTWVRHYQELLMSDELGDLYSSFTRQRPRLIKSSLFWSTGSDPSSWNTGYYALPPIEEGEALAWCDDSTTEDEVETCSALAKSAMDKTLAELSDTHGPDWQSWQWGQSHLLHQSHRPMSQIPGLKDVFELSAPVPGGRFTVNVAGVSTNPRTLNHSTFGPSYRGIFDMSDLDASLFVQPTGQSGNPFSDHYGDLFDDWLNVQYFEIPTETAVPANASAVLVLEPIE